MGGSPLASMRGEQDRAALPLSISIGKAGDIEANSYPSVGPAEGIALSTIRIRCGQYTSIGNYRDNNEDRLFVDPNRNVFVVADGMGGQAAGEQASQIAVDLIPDRLLDLPMEVEDTEEVHRHLVNAIIAANEEILAKGAADPSVQNMGTTVVIALLRAGMVHVAHIGDSRAYIVRENKIKSLTVDHNLAEALFQAGTISNEERETHRFKHVLYKYLGSVEAKSGPDISAFPMKAGDRFILATDGLTGSLTEKAILAEVLRRPDPQQCAHELVKLALEKGSKDNVTCVTVYVE